MDVQWDAGDYSGNSSGQLRWGLELLDRLSFRGDERVLDVGCGDGRITAEIATRVPKGSVVGVDKSEEMICFAESHFSKQAFPNLTFEVRDACHFNFRKEFDVVFSNAALHWIRDHSTLLRGIRGCLRPGGRILAQMGGKGNAEGILRVARKVIARKEWCPYFEDFHVPYAFYGLSEYRRWLRAAGLRVDRIELIPKEMFHEGRSGLSGWIRTTWLPYTRRVPEELRSVFIEQIVDEYVQGRSLGKDDIIAVRMVRLEFEAVND
jgi:trans-aconitate methyltransferase